MAKMSVVMLGPDGCGKTLYLAVLLKQQFVANSQNRWQLQPIHAGQMVFLNRVYTILTNRDEDFPQHNRRDELIDYEFQVHVSGTHEPFTPLSLSYLDFAGEILYTAQEGEPVIEEFSRRVKTADVVMGLFDGQDVLELMEHGAASSGLWHLKYGALLGWLASNMNQMRGPVHFVVTKWDLLDAAGYAFADVKARLLGFAHFRAFAHRETIPTYLPGLHQTVERVYPTSFLIPVSTLGAGFAYLDGNTMVKAGRTEVSPIDLTIPLALAVCNGIWVRWSRTENAEIVEGAEHFSPTIKDIIAALANVIEPITPGAIVSLVRLGVVLRRWLEQRGYDKRLDIDWLRQRREQYRNGEQQINNEGDAFEALVCDLALQIAEFKLANPEAHLKVER